MKQRFSSDAAKNEITREMKASDKGRDFLSCRVGGCALTCSVRRDGDDLYVVGAPRYEDCLEDNL